MYTKGTSQYPMSMVLLNQNVTVTLSSKQIP
ncbi:Uncharacterised protein [Mycobacterium tuberculosis]|nr:Uncharacterised protein [Mycobacterium tuberculosis]